MENNDFDNCECVPSRMVRWDEDLDLITSLGPLNTNQNTRGRFLNDGEFKQIFNTREFEALDHNTKMTMMWDQLTKIRKVKCQDWS